MSKPLKSDVKAIVHEIKQQMPDFFKGRHLTLCPISGTDKYYVKIRFEGKKKPFEGEVEDGTHKEVAKAIVGKA